MASLPSAGDEFRSARGPSMSRIAQRSVPSGFNTNSLPSPDPT